MQGTAFGLSLNRIRAHLKTREELFPFLLDTRYSNSNEVGHAVEVAFLVDYFISLRDRRMNKTVSSTHENYLPQGDVMHGEGREIREHLSSIC